MGKLTKENLIGNNIYVVAKVHSKSTPITLDGTNNQIWICFYADISKTFLVNKKSNMILNVNEGKNNNFS